MDVNFSIVANHGRCQNAMRPGTRSALTTAWAAISRPASAIEVAARLRSVVLHGRRVLQRSQTHNVQRGVRTKTHLQVQQVDGTDDELSQMDF